MSYSLMLPSIQLIQTDESSEPLLDADAEQYTPHFRTLGPEVIALTFLTRDTRMWGDFGCAVHISGRRLLAQLN